MSVFFIPSNMKKIIVKRKGKQYIKIATCKATDVKFSTPRFAKRFAVMFLLLLLCGCMKRATKDGDVPERIYFSSEYVVETYHQPTTGCYYVVYDDLDAGMDYELLQVDSETFRRIEAVKGTKNGKLKGILIEINGQFTYCHEE